MSSAADRVDEQPARSVDRPASQVTRREWLLWSVVTSGLLGGSGALRVFGSAAGQTVGLTARCPFKLDDLPRSYEGWNYVEGSETHLDQPTTRITGSTDHVIRSYYDELTGTTLSALVLYGPAEPVLPHTPQVCYPASGYKAQGAPADRNVRVDERLSALFREGVFVKPGGRAVNRQAVYHSYRLDGVWSPDVTDHSLPRRQAGLFKVQVQRRVLDGERTEGDEPIESFLRQLLPTMERMIATAKPATAASGPA